MILVDIELMEAWPMKCAYAVQEIFKTEQDYITALNDVLQVHNIALLTKETSLFREISSST